MTLYRSLEYQGTRMEFAEFSEYMQDMIRFMVIIKLYVYSKMSESYSLSPVYF